MAKDRKEIKDSIIITAKLIKETDLSWQLDCEGDVGWFPKKLVNFDTKKQELEVPKWKLRDLGWDF